MIISLNRTTLLILFNTLTGIVLHAGETVIDSAKMPNRIFPQSEIQFVSTDTGVIIRSIIDTRFPNRVFNKINQSERSNWDEDTDMMLYVNTLQTAFEEYKSRRKQDKDDPLIVDFIASSQNNNVIFYFGTIQWKELQLRPEYIRKNQEYILKDVFGDAADRLVEKLRTLIDGEK